MDTSNHQQARPRCRNDTRESRFPHNGSSWASLAERWNPNLCDTCYQLLSGNTDDRGHDEGATAWPHSGLKDTTDGSWLVGLSIKDNYQSRQVGCKFCVVVFKIGLAVGIWELRSEDQDAMPVMAGPEYRSPWPEEIHIEYLDPSRFLFRHGAKYRIWEEPLMVELPHCGPSSTSSSGAMASFVRWHMTNCLSNSYHVDCSNAVQHLLEDEASQNWPARILKVVGGATIMLVDFDATVISNKYAALSYCWGSVSDLPKGSPGPYVANSSSWKELQQGIPVADLGLTLQHAIQVCGWLNIEYIWIDSLCILQDSTE
ncbi:hypothetical protein B0T24DRAFT_725155 [Lasiosphaeria ovina]|uniref:Heterokaryon incompatibility domain-containing protein n=1 Tax=Lasiosphaeria ovina TaxID=92902 RepID=A0AAE0JTU5_9PEZI|nr:hypothetical protein B0T24DRAFT_725155 [Lasiosphaeria ovina]